MKQYEQVAPEKNDRRDGLQQPPASFLKYFTMAMDETTPGTVIIREALIPEPRPRWRSMAVATSVQIVITACLVVIPILFPETFAPVRQYLATALVKSEPIARWKPEPKRTVRAPRTHELVQALPAALAEPIPAPRIPSPVPQAPLTNPIRSTRSDPAIPDLAEVATSVVSPAPLATPSLSIPTLKRPREGVQTGGFAGHDGVDDGEARAGLNRGHGGVVNAKFSEGMPGGVRGGTANRAGVLQGSFSSDLAANTASKPREPSPASPVTPAHILTKPKPVYTPEGRSKKIEGEVLLQVVFTASGAVEVQSVLRGLGYGLDESAENAARQIKFQPAQKNGQPIDSAAVVHIVFQLAY
jgi:periplasmic protein TonB